MQPTTLRRTHTRRRLADPRPSPSPESRKRQYQHRDAVEAAQLAGHIGKSVHLYINKLYTLPSVRRGDWCMMSDKVMASRLNVKDLGTVRRHRKQAEKAGLIEVLGHGEDHKPCLVRPILGPNEPVFTDISARPSPAIVPAESSSTDLQSTSPPIPPAATPKAAAGGKASRVSFEELWKLNPQGGVGPANAAYLRLTDQQTIDARADLLAIRNGGPLPPRFSYAATHLAMIRCAQPLAPALAPPATPRLVFIREDTPQWAAWKAYGRAKKGLPLGYPVKNGGWWFPSDCPPEETAHG